MINRLIKHLSEERDFHIKKGSIKNIGGGCINNSSKIEIENGDFFCLKWRDSSPKRFFSSEAKNLQEISHTKTIKVPSPIIWEDNFENGGFLVLEWIEFSRNEKSASKLGEDLAKMHQIHKNEFGFGFDNFIGSTNQINSWKKDWIEFFIENRLDYQFKLLEKKNLINVEFGRMFDLLLGQAKKITGNVNEKPSLLHGDLWSGNWGWEMNGNPVIFDPACYYGNREADLAMMELFGSPGYRFWERYNECLPLKEGYRERMDFYNLYHILNHANLFGENYLFQAESIIRKYI